MGSIMDRVENAGAAAPIASPTVPLKSDGSPDWELISEESHCPLCDYQLRGLVEPRCPECGYRFEWPNLLDPSLRLHPYLFEHHPENNFRSFVRTNLSGWLPRRFWNSLSPVQTSRPKRLILYWVLSICALPLLAFLLLGLVTNDYTSNMRGIQVSMKSLMQRPANAGELSKVIKTYGSLQQYLDAVYPTKPTKVLTNLLQTREILTPLILLILLPISWPWITFLSLMIYQVSMRRARIKPIHVLRCTIYSADIVIAIVIGEMIWILTKATVFGFGVGLMRWDKILLTCTVSTIAALAIVSFIRLLVAYQYYLKMKHSILAVTASQIIIVLMGANIWLTIILWNS